MQPATRVLNESPLDMIYLTTGSASLAGRRSNPYAVMITVSVRPVLHTPQSLLGDKDHPD